MTRKGGNAWQMFTHKEDPRWDYSLIIDEKSCPTDYTGWTFKGRFQKDMKAKMLSAEEAEEEGIICTPKNYWTDEQPRELSETGGKRLAKQAKETDELVNNGKAQSEDRIESARRALAKQAKEIDELVNIRKTQSEDRIESARRALAKQAKK